jgi:uncharacterized protein YbaR (Trm112 family)
MPTTSAISPQFIELLRCPQTRLRLHLADEQLVARLNRAIVSGRLSTLGGRGVNERIDGGLVREDGQVLYPIFEGIPRLLADEAIPLSQLENAGERGVSTP